MKTPSVKLILSCGSSNKLTSDIADGLNVDAFTVSVNTRVIVPSSRSIFSNNFTSGFVVSFVKVVAFSLATEFTAKPAMSFTNVDGKVSKQLFSDSKEHSPGLNLMLFRSVSLNSITTFSLCSTCVSNVFSILYTTVSSSSLWSFSCSTENEDMLTVSSKMSVTTPLSRSKSNDDSVGLTLSSV